jgi:hypothetical protein
MVWQYLSLIPVGRRGVIFSGSNDFYLHIERGGQGSAPCGGDQKHKAGAPQHPDNWETSHTDQGPHRIQIIGGPTTQIRGPHRIQITWGHNTDQGHHCIQITWGHNTDQGPPPHPDNMGGHNTAQGHHCIRITGGTTTQIRGPEECL